AHRDARGGAPPRGVLRPPLRGAVDRRAAAAVHRPRRPARSRGAGAGRADRGAGRARVALPARLRPRRARSRQGGRVLDALPGRGRAAVRSDRAPASRATARRGDAARAARRCRRRAQPGGSVPASGWRLMKIADVLLVAGKELRETLRDRRTLAVMVLFPLVVSPLVSRGAVQGLSARIRRVEKVPARVTISGPQPLADKLRARLAARNHAGSDDFTLAMRPANAADVRAGKIDAAIAIDNPTGGASAASPVRLLYDETQERSRTARTRIEEALAPTVEPGCAAGYAINVEGVAPRAAMGG